MILLFDSKFDSRHETTWGANAGFIKIKYDNGDFTFPNVPLDAFPIVIMAHASDFETCEISVDSFIYSCVHALGDADRRIAFLFFSGGGGAEEILRTASLLPAAGSPNVHYYEGRFEDSSDDVHAFVAKINEFHANYQATGVPHWSVLSEEQWESRARRFALEVVHHNTVLRVYLGTYTVSETPFYEFSRLREGLLFGEQADTASRIAAALAAYYQNPSDAAAGVVLESCITYLALVAG